MVSLNKEENEIDLSSLDLEKLVPEQNKNYFFEYSKLYEANILLKNQLAVLIKEKNIIKHKIQKDEVNFFNQELYKRSYINN